MDSDADNTTLGATEQGTQRYRDRFSDRPGHFRHQQDWWLSSIGIGTYLGQPDAETDARYTSAVQHAIECGINVIDTANNYRFQRSERSIGDALKALFESGRAQRDEVIIATKGGYIPFDGAPPADPERYIRENYIDTAVVRPKDIVDGHCMAPEFLWYQIDQSRRNLGVECIDIYYLHNPETQLDAISRADFRKRLRAAFEFFEEQVDQGWIQYYGTATWNAYRASPKEGSYLSLEDVLAVAREVRGINHHCRFTQLPFNLALLEALTARNQRASGELMSALEAAQRFGVTVMCSATLFQARLLGQLPAPLHTQFGGLTTDAQRAIQFTRSAPGVATALVGMSRTEHVDENVAVTEVPPLDAAAFKRLFTQR
ncbi:MAG TPA: aldo/keto reductase [Anaerolineae bacterium]|nr:aldo/keto reductase [Anaerolineae bacterium]